MLIKILSILLDQFLQRIQLPLDLSPSPVYRFLQGHPVLFQGIVIPADPRLQAAGNIRIKLPAEIDHADMDRIDAFTVVLPAVAFKDDITVPVADRTYHPARFTEPMHREGIQGRKPVNGPVKPFDSYIREETQAVLRIFTSDLEIRPAVFWY